MRSVTRGMLTLAGIAALSLTFGSATAIASPTGSAAQTSTSTSSAPTTRACPATVTPGKFACLALKRTDKKPLLESQVSTPNSIPSGVGYGPSQLQSAYNIASAAASFQDKHLSRTNIRRKNNNN